MSMLGKSVGALPGTARPLTLLTREQSRPSISSLKFEARQAFCAFDITTFACPAGFDRAVLRGASVSESAHIAFDVASSSGRSVSVV